jgi:hypothetical protein
VAVVVAAFEYALLFAFLDLAELVAEPVGVAELWFAFCAADAGLLGVAFADAVGEPVERVLVDPGVPEVLARGVDVGLLARPG